MGQFQDVSFPIERVYTLDMESGVLAPAVSVASSPLSKIEQRIQATDEGAYRALFPAQAREYADARALWDFYLGVGGLRDSFRLRDPDSALAVGADELLGVGDGSTLVFQVVRNFGGYAHSITKPLAAGFVLAIAGVAESATRFTLDPLTGVVTLDANLSGAITNGGNVNPCQLTKASHGLASGDTVYLSNFTGTGWPTLNGTRHAVTKLSNDLFSVPVDASSFPAYSGNGGQFDTVPQVGEAVTASFTHDWQVRFARPLPVPRHSVPGLAQRLPAIELVEVDES